MVVALGTNETFCTFCFTKIPLCVKGSSFFVCNDSCFCVCCVSLMIPDSFIFSGDIKAGDFIFEVIDSNSSSITAGWTLNHRARSMKQAGFIKTFQYIINNNEYPSMNESYTFSDLSPNTLYNIVGKLVTTDKVTSSCTNCKVSLERRTLAG